MIPFRLLLACSLVCVAMATAAVGRPVLTPTPGIEDRITKTQARIHCIGTGCGRTDPARDDDVVRVAGADMAMHHLLPAFLEAYAADRGAVFWREGDRLGVRRPDGQEVMTVEVVATPGGAARQALAAGRVDLVIAAARPDGSDTAPVVALDGLAVVAHDGLGLRSLPDSALPGLLGGEIRSWQSVGGPDRPVLPILREAGSASRRLAAEVAGGRLPDAGLAIDNDAGIAAAVSRFPGAFGLVSAAAMRGKRVLALTDGCGRVLRPDPATLRAGLYPMTRPMLLLRGGAAPPARDRLADALLSAEGQGWLAARGFAAMRLVEAVEARRPPGVPVGAVRILPDLSFTASAVPSLAARETLRRLAEAPGGAAAVLLIGHAPGSGDEGATLAARAAEAARDAGLAVPVRTMGRADAPPRACAGDTRNRWVEIWRLPEA